MNIIPISSSLPVGGSYPVQSSSVPGGAGKSTAAAAELPFKNILQEAIANVEDTQAVSAQDSVAVALGEVDDLAEIGINSTKAELAMTLLIQMRNQVLDAYNELMRLSL